MLILFTRTQIKIDINGTTFAEFISALSFGFITGQKAEKK